MHDLFSEKHATFPIPWFFQSSLRTNHFEKSRELAWASQTAMSSSVVLLAASAQRFGDEHCLPKGPV